MFGFYTISPMLFRP